MDLDNRNLDQFKWVRSNDGWLAGVCRGLGERLGIEPWILRACLVIAIFWFGTGILFYLVLALCLPREDKLELGLQRRLLGVCSELAKRYNFEVGLVRVGAVFLAICSFGFSIFGYFVIYILLPKNKIHLGPIDSMHDSMYRARRS